MRQRIGALVTEARRRQRTLQLEDELLAGCEFEGLVGNSPIMWDLFSKIRRIAPHYRTVLVTGETGTGKDLVARALHRLSPATAGRYVVLNCSAVVETLFESELFGHVKGAFTGATQDKMGLFEHAHGGTLFLDEIGDMPLATQAKLLRALQHQEIQRVGSLAPRKVDVRVIAATNRDLRESIAAKQFREDLYYRLTMVEIHVPRLAERKEDLPLLERSFIARFAAQYGKTVRGLTPRARMLLGRHGWPGNVRELENVIGHACMMVMGDTIDVRELPEYLWDSTDRAAGAIAAAGDAATASAPNLASLEDHERRLIVQALETAGGNQSQAARL